MWSELYINDPDILSDVTEIAVKKLGYWIERRLREGRSSPPPRTFYLYRVLLNMWDTFRESTFHVGSRNGRNCCSPPCLRSHVDEPISIRRMKNKSRSEFDRYGKKKAKFLATFVANVIIVDDSPMFPYFMHDSSRSSYHRYSHVYYSLASRDNTSCRSPRVGQINFIRGSPRFANPCRPKRFEFIRVSR